MTDTTVADAGSVPADGGAAPTSPIPDSPAESTPSHDNFAGMEDNDYDLVELPATEEVTDGESGAPAPPAEEPKVAAPPPATTGEKPVPQAAPQQPKAPEQNVPATPRSALEQAIEGFRTNHQELAKWASTELFALSKEESEMLETDAVGAIPLLMGRVYSQALQATTNLIKNFVPEMVNQGVATTNARTAKANEALQEFYSTHTHLNPQQHGALVDKWARAFRAANPAASRSDAIKFVGNAVNAEIGAIAPPQGANGSSRAKPVPFAPARPGTRVQQPSKTHDPYEGMDMEYDNE